MGGDAAVGREPTYILMQCDLGSEPEIISAISEIPQVIEVRGTYGTFDIFCRIQADPGEADEILTRIRRIPHIRSTNTPRPILTQGGR